MEQVDDIAAKVDKLTKAASPEEMAEGGIAPAVTTTIVNAVTTDAYGNTTVVPVQASPLLPARPAPSAPQADLFPPSLPVPRVWVSPLPSSSPSLRRR